MLAQHPAPEIAIDRIQAWGDQDCPPHGIVTAGSADASAQAKHRIEQGTAAWTSGTGE